MSTAVEPADNNDRPDGEVKEEEDDHSGPQEFKFYIMPEGYNEILQKRWGLFTLITGFVYFYHFISVIFGVDMFCHWSRFTQCTGAEDFKTASAVYDTAIMLVTLFHIVEWVRQSIMITVVLVGVPWITVYYALGVNIIFGVITMIYAMAVGFGSDATCQVAQSGRSNFLKLQLVSFFLYMMWWMKHVLIFKLCNICFKPADKDDEGNLKYETWAQKQYEFEEEEDDD